MQADGVIGQYATGGAAGATIYKEAVVNALLTMIEDVATLVMSREHLVAIALQTARAKDYIRILQFVEHEASTTRSCRRYLSSIN